MSTPRDDQNERPVPSTQPSGSKDSLNPAALSVTDTARTLSRVGGYPITEAMIQRDIDEGAPTNSDGTINLVHYAAWLVKQAAGFRLETGGQSA